MPRTRLTFFGAILFLGFAASARDAQTAPADSARLSSGLEYNVREIRFSGDTSFVRTVNAPTYNLLMSSELDRVVKVLQQQGYYYATVEISTLTVVADSLDIDAVIKFGPQVVIHTIRCEGLAKTSPASVEKYVSEFEGKRLTPDRVREIKTRARQIPFLLFDSASITPLPGYSGATVILHLREPSAVSLQGNAGYRPDDNIGMVWSFDGTIRNVTGDGREVHLNSERRDRQRNTLLIEYRQPAIWFRRGEFEAIVQSRDYRDQFSEFAIGAGVSSFIGDHDRIGGKVGWSRTDFADSTPEYHKYTAGVEYGSSSLSDSANPITGYTLNWTADYQYRAYRKANDSLTSVRPAVNESKTRLSGAVYEPLISRSVIGVASLDLMSLFSNEDKLPGAELFLLGGPGTIRGYRTDQFAVRRAAIGSSEIRVRGKSGYFFLFGDVAYLYQQLSEDAIDESVKFGYGMGVRLIDRDKLVEIGLGWNPNLRLSRPQLMLKLATGL